MQTSKVVNQRQRLKESLLEQIFTGFVMCIITTGIWPILVAEKIMAGWYEQ